MENMLIAGILSYLLGSIPNGLWLGKAIWHTDLREHGSHNIGATNAWRTLGKPAGISIFLLDFAKGFPRTQRFQSIDDLRRSCPSYDCVVVGSDQMWNSAWCSPDYLPVVFLDFVPAGCRRIAYAVSFGDSEWRDVETAKTVGEMLCRFDGISVREKSGVRIVKELSGRDAVVRRDPTMLYDEGFYADLITGGVPRTNGNRFVFAHILDWSNGVREQAAVRNALEESGASEVLTAEEQGHPVSVGEWLRRIRDAEVVVTNSYHAIIFAKMFGRNLVPLMLDGPYSMMNERVLDLLETT